MALSDKKFAKIEKTLGKETLLELESMSADVLKDHIVSAEHAIYETLRELEANEIYLQHKDSIKSLSEGLRDMKKRQNAIIQYALSLLEDKGVK